MSQTGDGDKKKTDVEILLSSVDLQANDHNVHDMLAEVLLSQYEGGDDELNENINMDPSTVVFNGDNRQQDAPGTSENAVNEPQQRAELSGEREMVLGQPILTTDKFRIRNSEISATGIQNSFRIPSELLVGISENMPRGVRTKNLAPVQSGAHDTRRATERK